MTNILIVGAGGIGERHLRCFQKIGVGRVGIVESHPERRALIASRYQCPSYATWNEAQADGSWTAAVVATPAQTHIPIAIDLLQAGLDLLIEKPLSVSPDRLEELKAFDVKRAIRVAYVYRHMAPVAELKHLLDNGDFGQPLSAQVACGEDFSKARPDYASLYYARHETGGGAIQDVLTHFVNAMDWLVGPAQAIHCLAANRKLKDVSVEDTVSCSIRHAGGCIANYYLSQGQAPEESSFTIHCENGSLRADLTTARVLTFSAGSPEWIPIQFGPFERDDFYIRQAHAFLAAIKGESDPSCTLAEAIHSLQGNIAALASAQTNQLMEIKS
jgi:predicted dehydrogenase